MSNLGLDGWGLGSFEEFRFRVVFVVKFFFGFGGVRIFRRYFFRFEGIVVW